MTNTASNIIQELNELLEVSEEANEELVAENGELKDVLIGVLMELIEYKDTRIGELEKINEALDHIAFPELEFCDECGEPIE